VEGVIGTFNDMNITALKEKIEKEGDKPDAEKAAL